MAESKFDLCADSVTLDYRALLHVSRIAMRYSLIHLSDRLYKWYDLEPKLSIVDTQGMLDDAESLASATAAYHYLEEGRSRRKVIIENKEEGEHA